MISLTKECYDILEQLIQNGIDIHRYSQVFEESEDLEYFQKLTELLLQKRILYLFTVRISQEKFQNKNEYGGI